jgi:hypothetical protein
MVTPNPQGRDRQSTRCSTISRPKSDASRPCDGVTVAPQRRCDGATERCNTVSAGAVETAIVSLSGISVSPFRVVDRETDLMPDMGANGVTSLAGFRWTR